MGNEIEIDKTGWANWNLVKKFSVKKRTKNRPTSYPQKTSHAFIPNREFHPRNFGIHFWIGEILAPIRTAQKAHHNTWVRIEPRVGGTQELTSPRGRYSTPRFTTWWWPDPTSGRKALWADLEDAGLTLKVEARWECVVTWKKSGNMEDWELRIPLLFRLVSKIFFSTLKMKEDEPISHSYFQVFSYPESPRRLFFDGFFRKDYCFGKSVQSTIPPEYSALMVSLTSKVYAFLCRGSKLERKGVGQISTATDCLRDHV